MVPLYELPPLPRAGINCEKMVPETPGLPRRMGAWDIPLDLGRAEEEGEVGRCLGPHLSLPSYLPQCDRLAADCAYELRRHGVSYVSLWPGLVQTELVTEFLTKEEQPDDPLFKKVGKGRAGG